uniref:Uncharacterized protein n=1 Tax=Pipistrellus kuhlii TaxID=59472 RepID=A0A7J7XUT6_PIPKU|nr:hypothetical protein mPipKuh1_010423 [Pipistrellus kuhlii]
MACVKFQLPEVIISLILFIGSHSFYRVSPKIRHPPKIRPSATLEEKINIRHCLIFEETGYVSLSNSPIDVSFTFHMNCLLSYWCFFNFPHKPLVSGSVLGKLQATYPLSLQTQREQWFSAGASSSLVCSLISSISLETISSLPF